MKNIEKSNNRIEEVVGEYKKLQEMMGCRTVSYRMGVLEEKLMELTGLSKDEVEACYTTKH